MGKVKAKVDAKAEKLKEMHVRPYAKGGRRRHLSALAQERLFLGSLRGDLEAELVEGCLDTTSADRFGLTPIM